MHIAIDETPLVDNRVLSHRVRGTGFYLKSLKATILATDKSNSYSFFTRNQPVPPNADLVHYPYFEPFFLTLPLVQKRKTVVTVHDLTPLVFPEHFPPGVKGKIKWHMQKYSLQKAAHIITDSECSKKDIMKFTSIKEEKISVIYLAASEEFKKITNKTLLEQVKKKFGLPDTFALYVGDTTWNKNLPRLLEAISATDIPLVMVGKALVEKDYDRNNPWNKDLAQTQALIEKSKNIKTLGFVTTEDLVSLYNLATVFVIPSLYEGFGLPILEAMQAGCPVITSREGSLSEVAGDAAYYVDAYSIDSIEKGIQHLINDQKTQQELVKKGLQRAKEFTWEKSAKGTIQLYKKITT